MKLIDADAYERDMHELNERLYRWYLLAKDEDVRQRANGAIALLNEVRFMLYKQPTVDAVPVVYAKLLNPNPYGLCSHCNYLIDIRDGFNYCPKCGAMLKTDEVTKRGGQMSNGHKEM